MMWYLGWGVVLIAIVKWIKRHRRIDAGNDDNGVDWFVDDSSGDSGCDGGGD